MCPQVQAEGLELSEITEPPSPAWIPLRRIRAPVHPLSGLRMTCKPPFPPGPAMFVKLGWLN